MMGWWTTVASLATALILVACGSDRVRSGIILEAGIADACAPGTERCACYRNSTCNPGLSCASQTCVLFGGTGGTTSSSGGAHGAGTITAGAGGGFHWGANVDAAVDAAAASDAGRDAVVDAAHAAPDGGQNDVIGACLGAVSRAEQVPADIFLMIDQSLSMSCADPSGGDRWGAVTTPLESFLQDPAAAGINVGIGYFGDGTLSSCNPSDYQNPDVEIGPLPMNAQPIVKSLQAHVPISNTPTAAALTGAIDHAVDWKNQHPGHVVVVVLVTDGEPNACGAVSDVTDISRMGFMNSIPTYVVGVTSPGTTCNLDPNPPNQQDLDTVAQAGGTMSAFIVDVTRDAAQQVLAAMTQIRSKSEPPCQYVLPKAPSGQLLDPTKVNVQSTSPNGATRTTLLGVTMATCDLVKGGWYYDNPSAPTRIILCPSTCSTLGATPPNMVVGCATVVP